MVAPARFETPSDADVLRAFVRFRGGRLRMASETGEPIVVPCNQQIVVAFLRTVCAEQPRVVARVLKGLRADGDDKGFEWLTRALQADPLERLREAVNVILAATGWH